MRSVVRRLATTGSPQSRLLGDVIVGFIPDLVHLAREAVVLAFLAARCRIAARGPFGPGGCWPREACM